MTAMSATEIAMPKLSDSMEEGTIAAWLTSTGELVDAGQVVVEIETDKAIMEFEAETHGVLEQLVDQGATVAIGAPIARIWPPGTALDGSESTPDREPEPVAERGAEPPADRGAQPVAERRAELAAHDANGARSQPEAGRATRLLATPVARRLAEAMGVDLTAVAPTGRRGQIVKRDVLEASSIEVELPVSEKEPPARQVATQPLTSVQRTIARRMSESRASVPSFELEVDITMDACLELRAAMSEQLQSVPSVNDMIVKACALALTRHPKVNGSYSDEGFVLHQQINVGIAVAAPDSLLVPVLRDADRLPLGELGRRSRELTLRAREGRATPDDLSGATFTVSNLGMLGIDRFRAIISPPQAAILAIGAARERPVVVDGELQIGRVLTATLASDHRILYGADAAAFLTDVRDHLQAPLRLVV